MGFLPPQDVLFRDQALALRRHRALEDCPVQGLQRPHSQAVIHYLLSLLYLSSFGRHCCLRAANVLQNMYKYQTHLPVFPLVLPVRCMGAAGSVLELSWQLHDHILKQMLLFSHEHVQGSK